MPRCAREKSSSGIFHIMLRGINKQTIFEDDEDRERFLETLNRFKAMSKYKIYGYCLMSNHTHLLLKETEDSVSNVIKRISSSYVYWYNWKYDRCGHLFQERYKSEIVEDEEYFLTVLRYIHLNPVRAGLVDRVQDYPWSSYCEYIKIANLTDTDFALEIFASEREKAVSAFIDHSTKDNKDICLDLGEKVRLTDNEVRELFVKLGIEKPNELQQLDKERRNEIIRKLKEMDRVTIRQLSRMTGISKSVIDRI